MFYKKAVIKNFAMLTGKELCWSLFLVKLQQKHLQAAASETNLISTKLFIKIMLCKTCFFLKKKFTHKEKCGTVKKQKESKTRYHKIS